MAIRRAAGLAAALLAASAAVLAPAGPASAQADLVRSYPAAGATVPATLSEVSLEFAEPVSSPVVTITDGGGDRVDGPVQIMGKRNRVVVPLDPSVREGRVDVRWKVRDGGATFAGVLNFTIAPPAPASADSAAGAQAAAAAGAAAVRTRVSSDRDTRADGDAVARGSWAALRGAGVVAVMLALGMGLFLTLAHDGAPDRRRVLLAVPLAGVVGLGLVAAAALLSGDGGPLFGGDGGPVIRLDDLSRRETVSLGLLGGGLLLVVAGAAVAKPGRWLPRALVVVGVTGAGLSFAPSGHAAASSSPPVAEVALALHVTAMGAWLGGLAGLALTLAHRRQVRTAQGEALMIRRYGLVAASAVAAGLLAGLVVTAFAVPGPSALWHTRWGAVVLAKIVAVLVVAVLAVMNLGASELPAHPGDPSRPLLAELPAFTPVDGDVLVPRAVPSRRALRGRLGAEALVLAAAAAGSGVLVQADPHQGSREYLRVVEVGRRVAAVRSDDLSAGRPRLEVSIRDFDGSIDGDVTRLSIRLSGPAGDTGPRYDLIRPAELGAFDAQVDVPSPGRWVMQISYVVADDDRGDATIVLPVG
jgi:copper transport protein